MGLTLMQRAERDVRIAEGLRRAQEMLGQGRSLSVIAADLRQQGYPGISRERVRQLRDELAGTVPCPSCGGSGRVQQARFGG